MALPVAPAGEEALDTLVAHRRRMWEEMGRLAPGAADPSEGEYRKWLQDRLRSGQLAAFAARSQGRIVGSGCVLLQELHPRPHLPATGTAYILSVWTDLEARRQGVARAVAEACIAWARQRGCRRVVLHASTAGQPLYQSMGFAATNEMALDLV